MSISKAIDLTMRQAIPNPASTCNACQRSGLPILLLRTAYAPHPRKTQSYRLAADSEITYVPMRADQLRILRQGYVYVLLDQEVWHAYQVTPEGALRQFSALQPPLAPGEPLHEYCATQHHDVTASFINIDTLLYARAWIAFANDPWPTEVLDRYRQGIAGNDPDATDRFVELDLNIARTDPASVGIAMTPTDLGLDDVLEYTAPYAGNYSSAHGFYPRLNRLPETRNHVRSSIEHEQLPNGVLALTLPDPVGLVMECNAQRTAWFQAMQQWRAEPQRHFDYFTSQALLGIRELHDAQAMAQAVEDTEHEARRVEQWNDSPIGTKAYLPPVNVEAQAPRAIERKQQQARERLEQRYDERARAAFQADYDRELQHWQAKVDEVGKLYAHHYASRAFQLIGYLDYSATSPLSVEDFIAMMAACLAGGPTEALAPADTALGPTQHIWQQLLEDHQSLLYQALLAKNKALLQQLVEALSGDDLGKVYDAVKAMAGSNEGRLLMIKSVQDAIGQLLAATASASNALGQHASAQTRKLIGHVHSAAFLLYAGQPVTQVRLSLTLGEYMGLLNEALQERTDAFLGQLDKQFREPAARKVRAMVLSGAINIAAAGNRSQSVEVMVWTLESAESLQARLVKLRDGAVGGVGEWVRSIALGTDTLMRGASEVAQGLKVSATAARSVASDAFRGLRGTAASPGSAGLLLAMGSIWFHQDSLRRNVEALQNTSQGDAEALAAIWSSSLGVLGASVEATGITAQLLKPAKAPPGIPSTVHLGTSIAKFGGVISALAGIMDGAQYFSAAVKATKHHDANSARKYWVAGAAAFMGSASGIYAVFLPGSLLGAIGIAVFLGLAAYAMATSAMRDKSSLTEIWARKCRWGMPYEHRHWVTPNDIDAAIGALNAAALGVRAEVSINTRFEQTIHKPSSMAVAAVLSDNQGVPFTFTLDYYLSLPNYNPKISRYTWQLTLYRAGSTKEISVLSGNTEKAAVSVAPAIQKHSLFSIPLRSEPLINFNEKNNTLSIQDSIPLSDFHDIQATELLVTYWPDYHDQSGYAKAISREDKIKSPEQLR